jgi:type I restriction enzyme M protein
LESFGQITSFIWGVADLIRDTFKRGKYQDVILPLTVLRRLDCVLEPSKQDVLDRYNQLKGRLDNLDPQLRRASGHAFYNTSPFTFATMLQDSANIAANLRAWINGFSENMREVLEKFDFDNTIAKLDQAGLLFLVLERFKSIDLHPNVIDNFTMGSIFEELIRKFNEALNENPGEHFTPRDVIQLMVALMVAPDRDALAGTGIVRTVYDPCCGSGGMLTIARKKIRSFSQDADIHLYGQEVNPETYAVCKSDLFLTTQTGRDAENISFGSTLSKDAHASSSFDYLITNPPYGKDWKMDQQAIKAEHGHGFAARFGAGLPRISDGQLLFLQHMVAHMKPAEQGGSRVAIIMNGSPLFTGDAGSGESEIRRWLMEEDMVEAIIALPEQLFYNTGIATYVWLVSNRKSPERCGKVQLINASGEGFWKSMRRSLGDKRREVSGEQAERILDIHRAFEETEHSKIFATTDFGFRKIRVDRPLRLSFQVTEERIERLQQERAFQALATSKKKDPATRAAEEAAGRELQTKVLEMVTGMPEKVFDSRSDFNEALKKAVKGSGLKVAAPVKKAILSALSERDETAAVCRDRDGDPEPDPELRDYEKIPLGESIKDYFEREVTPHVPDAWIDALYTDDKDGKIGKVGYEINFNRYFYVYTPPRPLEVIEAEIRELEAEIIELLREVTG